MEMRQNKRRYGTALLAVGALLALGVYAALALTGVASASGREPNVVEVNVAAMMVAATKPARLQVIFFMSSTVPPRPPAMDVTSTNARDRLPVCPALPVHCSLWRDESAST